MFHPTDYPTNQTQEVDELEPRASCWQSEEANTRKAAVVVGKDEILKLATSWLMVSEVSASNA